VGDLGLIVQREVGAIGQTGFGAVNGDIGGVGKSVSGVGSKGDRARGLALLDQLDARSE
jgi:hypothetical protein